MGWQNFEERGGVGFRSELAAKNFALIPLIEVPTTRRGAYYLPRWLICRPASSYRGHAR